SRATASDGVRRRETDGRCTFAAQGEGRVRDGQKVAVTGGCSPLGRGMLPVSSTGRNRGRISQFKLALVSSASLLAVALLADNPSAAQTVAQAGQDPSRIRQVDVEAPRPPRRPNV